MLVRQLALVLFFVLMGGFFAAVELALISLRPGQISRLAAQGRRGRTVQRVTENPSRLLSSVQIGVTLSSLLSAAFGAESFGTPLATWLQAQGVPVTAARPIAVVGVTLFVAYLSLVIGELAPKRIGLQRAEAIGLIGAPIVEFIASATRPVIWVLQRSSDVVVRLFGVDPNADRGEMTEQELRDMVASTEQLTQVERRLIGDVLDAGDRPLREVMIPRLDVAVLSADATVAVALAGVRDRPYSRYPVVDGGLDDPVGFVHVRDLYAADQRLPSGTTLRELARPLMRQPDSRRALPTLAQMRREGVHVAVVVDEYGGGAGLVTLEDLLEELVGDITDEFDPGHRGIPGAEGTDREGRGRQGWLPDAPVDAQLRLEEFEEATGVALPEGPYDTAAGWVLHELGRIPDVGDQARFGDVTVTVTAMRSRRVEQVRLEHSTAAPDPAEGTGTAAPDDAATDDAEPEGSAPVDVTRDDVTRDEETPDDETQDAARDATSVDVMAAAAAAADLTDPGRRRPTGAV